MYDVEALIREPGVVDGLRRAVHHGGPPPVLRDAKVKLTSRCNLRCGMCKYWRTRGEQRLSGARWAEVLGGLRALGCRKVHLSGGEVLLHPDFFAIVACAVGLGLKTNFTTNGTLIDRERARRVVKSRVNSVSLSLDDPSAAVHDAIRGVPGAYAATVRAAELLVRYSERFRPQKPLKVRINVVLMRANYRKLPGLVRLAGDLGAVDVTPMPVDEKGEARARLSRGQIERYNREVAPAVAELRRRYGFADDPQRVYPFGVTPREVRHAKRGHYALGLYEHQPCFAPWLHTFLAWDGEVYPCCMTNRRLPALGSVAVTDPASVFHGEPYSRLRGAFARGQLPEACARCDQFLAHNRLLWRHVGPGLLSERGTRLGFPGASQGSRSHRKLTVDSVRS